MENYKIIKELGHGMFGTVYKIEYKNKYFAMKIEHVLDEDKEKNIKSPVWRELDFSEKFARKHKDQFMQMYYYDFIDNCDHKQKYSVDLKNFDKYHKDKIINLSRSKTCVRKVYELIDGNVRDLIPKLNLKQIYSFILQLAIIVKTLEKNNYIHGDFHSGNIGYIETNKQYIKYGKKKIPTYGYIYKAIDLGSILHPKYKLSKRDKKWYKDLYKRELISPLRTSLIDDNKFWDFIENNNIKLNFKKDMMKFKKSKLYDNINKLFPEIKNDEMKFNLCDILFTQDFQKLILGNHFKNIIEHKLYISIPDIMYLFKINFNTDKIIDYFLMKISLN
jgi:serine/threonine protein kinase